MLTLSRLQKLFEAMKGRVVLRGLLGGLGMGIIGALLPLTLFSGESETAVPDRPGGTDRGGDADRVGRQQTAGDLPPTGNRLKAAICSIMFARRRFGPGLGSSFSRYSSCGHRRGDDGGRTRRGPEGAFVRGALYVGPGAKGNRGRDCRCRAQRIADRATGTARRAPRREPDGISPGCRVTNKLRRVTDEEAQPPPSSGIERFIPGLTLFKGVTPALLRSELIVAVTVFAVLVPSAMAYGELAGVRACRGLYVALGAMVMYALFGSSRLVIMGPEATSAIPTAAAVAVAASLVETALLALRAAMG